MQTGRIKKLAKDRGFGFITGADGKEVFFHRSEVRGAEFDTLTEGQQVSFDAENDPKGPRARNVRIVGAMSR